jgi:hypothetical protein
MQMKWTKARIQVSVESFMFALNMGMCEIKQKQQKD